MHKVTFYIVLTITLLVLVCCGSNGAGNGSGTTSDDTSTTTTTTTPSSPASTTISSITINDSITTLACGFKRQLTTSILPEKADAQTLTWSSSNATIISVDDKGLITGLKNGSATVTVKVSDSISDTISITVVSQLINTVLVDGGTFSMGSSLSVCTVTPVHSVTLSSFYIANHETTQLEYRTIMYSSPSSGSGVGNYYPVYSVTFYDAALFCNTLSQRDGLESVYTLTGTTNIECDLTKNGWRLPTEAEWEFAARGGNSSGGYVYSGSNVLTDVAWVYSNSGEKSKPVGTLKANEIGIYDMTGNVWEWVNDYYQAYTADNQTNPSGPITGTERIYRGGGFGRNNTCYVFYRVSIDPDWSNTNLGFRVARNF